jgi:glycosyltransferase involved in cell wall biosynthesis
LKILAITSRYPPYHFGGYGIRCKNILDELAGRGHEVIVITSKKETGSRSTHQAAKYKILRKLHIRIITSGLIRRFERGHRTHTFGMFLIFVRELLFDLWDMGFIDRQMMQFQPDVIYLGHITILTRALMPYFAVCRVPIVYDEGGSGLIDSWEEKGIWYKFVGEYTSRFPIINAVKPWIVKLVCTVSAERIKPQWAWPDELQIIINSELNYRNVMTKGVPITDAKVIHSGIDINKFYYLPKAKIGYPLILIVPGRIEPCKGQIDAVRLLARLGEQGIDAKMILVGEKWARPYYMEIKKEIKDFRLEDRITLGTMVTQDKLVELYHQADICFFPSYQKVGFSRIPLEAMSCGCTIISYGNEGSDEIIHDGQTGFLAAPADYSGIADIVKKLVSDPEMIRVVVSAARKDIEENCSMEQYVDRIEGTIKNAVRVH